MKLELKLGFYLLLYHLVGLGQVQATLSLRPGPSHTPFITVNLFFGDYSPEGILCKSPQE